MSTTLLKSFAFLMFTTLFTKVLITFTHILCVVVVQQTIKFKVCHES
jgi:hypothetical protein